VWNRRDVGSSTRLVPFGDDVVVLDDDEEHNGVVVRLDAAGNVLTKVSPRCDGSPASSLAFTGVAVPLVPQQAIVLGFDRCWQRVVLTDGSTTWSADAPGSISASTTHVAHDDATLVVTSDATTSRIDLATGALTGFPTVPNVDMVPVAVHGQVAVMRLANARGIKHYAVAGLDAGTGAKVWEVGLQQAEPADPPDAETIFLSDGDARFTANLDGGTLRVLVFDHDSRDFRIDNIDVATGAESKATVASDIGDSLPDFDVGGWQAALVVASNPNDRLVMVDTASARIVLGYP
jgi:hypothetical protein